MEISERPLDKVLLENYGSNYLNFPIVDRSIISNEELNQILY